VPAALSAPATPAAYQRRELRAPRQRLSSARLGCRAPAAPHLRQLLQLLLLMLLLLRLWPRRRLLLRLLRLPLGVLLRLLRPSRACVAGRPWGVRPALAAVSAPGAAVAR